MRKAVKPRGTPLELWVLSARPFPSFSHRFSQLSAQCRISPGCALISSVLPHFRAQPVLGSLLCCPWSTTRIPSLPCSWWRGWCRRKGRKERQARSRGGISCSLPQQKLYRSKASPAASLVAGGAAGAVQLLGSQPLEVSKLGTAAGLGSVPLLQPQPHESSAQQSTASQAGQQDGQQRGRSSTWAQRDREGAVRNVLGMKK